jgi:TnpA family transposase
VAPLAQVPSRENHTAILGRTGAFAAGLQERATDGGVNSTACPFAFVRRSIIASPPSTRTRRLKDQQLYRLDGTEATGAVGSIFRGTVDVSLIREQWHQLVRVAASLRNRTAPAHVILERLAASNSPSDRLAKALTMLGRVVKTTYILRYAHDAELRARVHRQLNRGESRHAPARRLFLANQGAFRVGDYEEMMNKVSALSLLSNAVVVWNSVRYAQSLVALQARSQTAAGSDLSRLWPLANAHVIPSATYHFDRASDGRRPLA